MKNESGNTAAVNFLGKVMREQPEVIEELSPRDAYMLFNYSDPESGRSTTELGEIFGISGSYIRRRFKSIIKYVHEKADVETRYLYPVGSVLDAASSNSLNTREKYGQAKKRDWQKPQFRKRMNELNSSKWQNPDRKARMIENVKKTKKEKVKLIPQPDVEQLSTDEIDTTYIIYLEAN